MLNFSISIGQNVDLFSATPAAMTIVSGVTVTQITGLLLL